MSRFTHTCVTIVVFFCFTANGLAAQVVRSVPESGQPVFLGLHVFAVVMLLVLLVLVALAWVLTRMMAVKTRALKLEVAERKRVENELSRSEERFQHIAHAAGEYVWEVDLTGRFVYMTDMVESVLGYKASEMIGRNPFDFVFPADDGWLRSQFEKYSSARKAFSGLEHRCVSKGGDVVWVGVNGAPILDETGSVLGYRGAARNITLRKEAEQKIRNSEDRLRTIMDVLPYAIQIIDENGRYVDVIANKNSLLPGQADDLIGRNISDYLPPDTCIHVMDSIQSIVSTGKSRILEYGLDVMGSRIWFEAHGSLMPETEGEPASVLWVMHDATERKQAEEKLVKSESHLRSITEAVPDVIMILDSEGHFCEVLAHDPSLLVDSPDKLKGRLIQDIIPPQLASKALDTIKKTIETGEMQKVEYQLKVQAGDRWFEGRAAPLQTQGREIDSVVWLIRDITENKNAEKAIREKTDALARFTNDLKTLHRITTTKYEEVDDLYNDYLTTGCALLGMSTGIISRIEKEQYTIMAINSPFEEIAVGDSYPLGDTYCAAVFKEGRTIDYHQVGSIAGMHNLPVYKYFNLESYIGAPIVVGDRIYGTLNFSDISEHEEPLSNYEREIVELMAKGISHFISARINEEARRRAQEELKNYAAELEASNRMISQQAEELLQARDEAVRNARIKSDFLATISHEIRTPMNAIIGFANLMLDTDLDETQLDYQESILSSAGILLEIINQVLDLSKIEAGKAEPEETLLNLHEMFEGVLELFVPKAAEKKIDLVYDIDAKVPLRIVGDATRLRQILMNLVANAVKFTDEGEIQVLVEMDDPLVHAAAGEGSPISLRVSVSDTGIGIPADKTDKLFQPFTQVDSSITRKYGGAGLGLAISSRFCSLMGGRMWLESTEGEGSTFNFTFIAYTTAPELRIAGAQTVGKLKDKSLLVVAANAVNRRLLNSLASRWDMTATCCSSSQEALHKIEQEGLFDAAVIDFDLSELDGVELALEIQRLYGENRLPMILLAPPGKQRLSLILPDDLFTGILRPPVREKTLRRSLLHAFDPDLEIETETKEKARDGHQGPFPSLNILIAEDNPVNLKVAAIILEKLGHKHASAADGVETLDVLKLDSYDLVLMDVQMPGMDGLEVTQRIRGGEAGEHNIDIPIIAMTANAMEGDREICLAAGMDGYLQKPVKPTAIDTAIRELKIKRPVNKDRPWERD